MERKLVKQGQNALTITIPSTFVKHNRLKPGDAMKVFFNTQQVTISPASFPVDNEITIDAAHMDRSMLFHQMFGAYISGFQRIIVLNAPLSITQSFPGRLIGLVIDSQSKTKTVFVSLIRESDPTLEATIRRCGHLLVELSRVVSERSISQSTDLEIANQENLLDEQLIYCLRTLHRFPPTNGNLYRYFLLCTTFESIGDQLQEIGHHIEKNPKLGPLIHHVIERYVQLVFESNFTDLYSFLKKTKKELPTKSFLDGLVFFLLENLHNNLGFLIRTKKSGKDSWSAPAEI